MRNLRGYIFRFHLKFPIKWIPVKITIKMYLFILSIFKTPKFNHIMNVKSIIFLLNYWISLNNSKRDHTFSQSCISLTIE